MKEVFEPILFKPSSFLSCVIETCTLHLKLKSQDSLASLRHTLLHDIVFLIQWCDFLSVLPYCISFFSNFFLPASMPDYCSLTLQYTIFQNWFVQATSYTDPIINGKIPQIIKSKLHWASQSKTSNSGLVVYLLHWRWRSKFQSLYLTDSW